MPWSQLQLLQPATPRASHAHLHPPQLPVQPCVKQHEQPMLWVQPVLQVLPGQAASPVPARAMLVGTSSNPSTRRAIPQPPSMVLARSYSLVIEHLSFLERRNVDSVLPGRLTPHPENSKCNIATDQGGRARPCVPR